MNDSLPYILIGVGAFLMCFVCLVSQSLDQSHAEKMAQLQQRQVTTQPATNN